MISLPLGLIASTSPLARSRALIWLPVTWATYTRPSGPVRRPFAPNSRLGVVSRSSRQPSAALGLAAMYREGGRDDVAGTVMTPDAIKPF